MQKLVESTSNQAPRRVRRPAVFLDRDGTLIEDCVIRWSPVLPKRPSGFFSPRTYKMQITIDSTNVELDDALREYIELRANSALTRYSQQIKRIVLHVENAIRPVGGVDVCCDVSVKLISDEEVEIEVQDSEIRSAVACAVDRAGCTVERKLQERREPGSKDK